MPPKGHIKPKHVFYCLIYLLIDLFIYLSIVLLFYLFTYLFIYCSTERQICSNMLQAERFRSAWPDFSTSPFLVSVMYHLPNLTWSLQNRHGFA